MSEESVSDAVKVALEAVVRAEKDVLECKADVVECIADVKRWNEHVKSSVGNIQALDLYVKLMDKSNKRLKESNERLKEASERLKAREAYHLQITGIGVVPESPQVNWTVASQPCPRLVVNDDDQLIKIPADCVDGTGIGRLGQALILYRRSALVQQWNEINRCSIQTYARLWVVGPPGTGKSCAALAFAWSLNRLHWDVIWIHYSRADRHLNCVWLKGTEKAVCVVEEESIGRDLGAILNTTSDTRKTIVFLDGYVKSSKAGEEAHLKCLRWHQKDKIRHRLVCVCSMVSVGKEYRPDLYPPIPTNVDLGHSEMEDVEMSTGELHNLETNAANDILAVQTSKLHRTTQALPVHTQMLFKLTSWRFGEYKEAVLNDNFFYNVLAVFPTYSRQVDPEKEENERIKLLREKYFVAGGSARLMFELTTETAIETLDEALAEAPNIETYLQGFVGDSSSGVVNRLLARYDSPHGYDIRLVSEYVVRAFAIMMGPRLLQNFARACNVNPSVDGFILEAWFFAELSHNDLKWSEYVDSRLQEHQWPKSSIVYFDPMKYPLAISMDGLMWVAPIKWNQGGYDAVFVDKAANLVRFVQVTRAERHEFKPEFFLELLFRLLSDMDQFAVVELYFVVPLVRLPTFALPVSEQGFRTMVLQVVFKSRGSRRIPDQTSQACNVKVKAIGVNYEIANRHPVEGLRVA